MPEINITIALYYSPVFTLIFGVLSIFIAARVAIRLWDLVGL